MSSREVIVGGPQPEARHYVPAATGRPSAPMEAIERVLWEVAVCGGNVSKACRRLREHDEEMGVEGYVPHERTARQWVKTSYRNRYHEIVTGRMRELEARNEANSVAFALRAQDVKEDALKQISAGLQSADAVEASTILRNLSAATKSDLDGAAALRRSAAGIEDTRTLKDIANALARLGAAHVVESTAEPITDAETV